MCDRESFAKIRDAIGDLQKADAVQSEQIKTLFKTTEAHGTQMNSLTTRLVWAIVVALFISVAAIVYGAIGAHGFNAVMQSVPTVAR